MVGLAGIPVVYCFPEAASLVWLALVALPANGPLSPILPTAFEPLIMEAAKYQHPLWVAVVSLGSYMYMEYLNWHLYRWVLNRKRLSAFREKRWVKRSMETFGRWPFGTIVIFALTPLPFWVARILAILRKYPLPRFMVATAIGRFPRFLMYAWIGETLRLSTLALVGVAVGGALALILLRLGRRKPLLNDVVLDAPEKTSD
jgi:uncharacterized membrane protein YdjX (TVP38/TMEM64 family)